MAAKCVPIDSRRIYIGPPMIHLGNLSRASLLSVACVIFSPIYIIDRIELQASQMCRVLCVYLLACVRCVGYSIHLGHGKTSQEVPPVGVFLHLGNCHARGSFIPEVRQLGRCFGILVDFPSSIE